MQPEGGPFQIYALTHRVWQHTQYPSTHMLTTSTLVTHAAITSKLRTRIQLITGAISLTITTSIINSISACNPALRWWAN